MKAQLLPPKLSWGTHLPDMRIKILILWALLFAVACSFAATRISSIAKNLVVPEKTFLTITNGTSLEAVRAKLGIAARHEFTILETAGNYILINCLVGNGTSFDLLFRDKSLIKIIRPPSFPELKETYLFRGTPATRMRDWDIGETPKLVSKAMSAPALTHDQIITYLKPDEGLKSKRGNVLPAFLATDFFSKMAPRIKKDYQTNQELLERFDGCRAEIGMHVDAVDKVYGKPLRVLSMAGAQTARIYGEDSKLEINPMYRFSNVAVVFDARGQAKAIYSHGFFCEGWIK